MHQTLPLPRGWNRRVKAAILQVLSLAHYCFSTIRGWAAESDRRRVRTRAEMDHLRQEVALLQEELRIKDARMMRIPAPRRARHTPMERMAILELRALRGLSALQTGRRLLLSHTAIADWMKQRCKTTWSSQESGGSGVRRRRIQISREHLPGDNGIETCQYCTRMIIGSHCPRTSG